MKNEKLKNSIFENISFFSKIVFRKPSMFHFFIFSFFIIATVLGIATAIAIAIATVLGIAIATV